MEELCQFLIGRMILDFDGEVDQETVTRFLADDSSPLARDLRGRLLAEGGLEDFLIVLSDCLRDSIRTGITPEKVREQISTYVES
ncbi:MAG: hypothetical protein RBU37_08310 [Myxococcota bacterium]|jgi:hypothetical protein|nr:hypothetical protein [Myxococcota bacterium]